MRRIALFSDIHGNLSTLDGVLADLDARGLTERYCLGDLVGYGPDPAGVVDRIRSAGVPTLQGNYDEGIGNRRGECGCYYANDQARADGAASYAFTEARIDDERAAWLAALPGEIRFAHEGARVLLTHGSPRKINEYLLLDRTDQLLARLAVAAEADIVCVGHVHVPYHRTMPAPGGRRVHYISSGSVGKPKDGDPRACWVELVLGTREEIAAAALDDSATNRSTDRTWVGVVIHRVPYDIEAVATAMRDAGLPATLAEALRRA